MTQLKPLTQGVAEYTATLRDAQARRQAEAERQRVAALCAEVVPLIEQAYGVSLAGVDVLLKMDGRDCFIFTLDFGPSGWRHPDSGDDARREVETRNYYTLDILRQKLADSTLTWNAWHGVLPQGVWLNNEPDFIRACAYALQGKEDAE